MKGTKNYEKLFTYFVPNREIESGFTLDVEGKISRFTVLVNKLALIPGVVHISVIDYDSGYGYGEYGRADAGIIVELTDIGYSVGYFPVEDDDCYAISLEDSDCYAISVGKEK